MIASPLRTLRSIVVGLLVLSCCSRLNGDSRRTSFGVASQAEEQSVRDARVASLTIEPGNVTVLQKSKFAFVAIPFDVNGVPVGGVLVSWSAIDNQTQTSVPIGPDGMFVASSTGTFTITAQAMGRQATATATGNTKAMGPLSRTPAAHAT